VLPRLGREADSEWLAHALAKHLAQTRDHTARVEGAFVSAGAEPTAAASKALEGLCRDHDHLPGIVEPRLRDIFLATEIAKIEHLEIAMYEALTGLAMSLGLAVEPLEENLREERQALERVEQAAGRLRGRLSK
jgi:ferritin-like metal-binding protein YciE